MTRLSSRWTYFYKRVFPVMWFGFIALFLLLPWLNRHQAPGLPLPVFIMPPTRFTPFARSPVIDQLIGRRQTTDRAAARPAVRPEKMQPPRKVPSSAR
jgi:hypothetical protein